MYTQFFGLREKPFSLSPDPRYLYLSDSHREALAHLLYGIEQGEGFIAITGEVGTGKTTLCRTLLDRIEPGTEVAFIFNPQLSGLELLQSIAAEFGLETGDRTRRELTEALNRFLLTKKREGRRVLLIVDEAQVLEREALEQVRLLSNLETNTSKLIQIILIGQPELDTVLEAPDLRQLRQRITVRWKLGALSSSETREYVRHRLRIAAGEARELFTDGALREIHRHSRGVPRLVNLLCDRSLLAGYGNGVHQVGLGLVTQVERELKVGGAHEPTTAEGPHRRRWWRHDAWPVIAGAAAVLVATLLVVVSVAPSWLGLESPDYGSQVIETAAAAAATESAVSPPAALATVNAPPPLAAPAVMSGPDLPTALARTSPGAATARVLDATLEAWGLPPLRQEFLSLAQAEDQLVAEGFAVLSLEGMTLGELLAIDRPAILLLAAADEIPRPVLLRKVDGEAVFVRGIDDAEHRIPIGEFEAEWGGTARVPWRDHADLPGLMREGVQGPPVRWLQRALAGVGLLEGTPTGLYDVATANAVRRLQLEAGLLPDGRLGPLTKIRLYERLGNSVEAPRLRTRS